MVSVATCLCNGGTTSRSRAPFYGALTGFFPRKKAGLCGKGTFMREKFTTARLGPCSMNSMALASQKKKPLGLGPSARTAARDRARPDCPGPAAGPWLHEHPLQRTAQAPCEPICQLFVLYQLVHVCGSGVDTAPVGFTFWLVAQVTVIVGAKPEGPIGHISDANTEEVLLMVVGGQSQCGDYRVEVCLSFMGLCCGY